MSQNLLAPAGLLALHLFLVLYQVTALDELGHVQWHVYPGISLLLQTEHITTFLWVLWNIEEKCHQNWGFSNMFLPCPTFKKNIS
jgi:hypothetical protein